MTTTIGGCGSSGALKTAERFSSRVSLIARPPSSVFRLMLLCCAVWMSGANARPVETALTQSATDFTARLEALSPSNPTAYFELAEEVSDVATTPALRDLARHLFKLAGALDRDRLGRSAAIALGDLATDHGERRRYAAMAHVLDRSDGAINWLDGESVERVDAFHALTLSRAFGYYRAARGRQALRTLRDSPGAESLFRRYGDRIGGVQRFITNAEVPQYDDGITSPLRTERAVAEMLELEASLLNAHDPTWAMDLLLNEGRTLIEVDPDQVAEQFGIDPRLAWYRNGTWVGRP